MVWRLVSGQKSLSVEEFVESCSTKDWRVYNVRETTRGSLKLRVLRKSVYVWDKQSEPGRRYELLVTLELGCTGEPNGPECKKT
jgi:hypothetical protein